MDNLLHPRKTVACNYASIPNSTIEVNVWMRYYIPLFYVDVITQICPNFSQFILVVEGQNVMYTIWYVMLQNIIYDKNMDFHIYVFKYRDLLISN